MTRALSLFALLAGGCIIYEEDWDHRHDSCRSCGVDDTSTVGDDDDDVTPEPEPEPEPEPQITADLELTETSAYPGDSLLSSLVVVSGQVDLAAVEAVVFERDVVVVDTLHRESEIVLLLQVADDAAPGEVDVFVETKTGAGFILAEPFTVLEPDPGTVCTGTGGGGTGTGGGTDTGCP